MAKIAIYCSEKTLKVITKKLPSEYQFRHYDDDFSQDDIVVFSAKERTELRDSRPALMKTILKHHPKETLPRVVFLKSEGKSASRKEFLAQVSTRPENFTTQTLKQFLRKGFT